MRALVILVILLSGCGAPTVVAYDTPTQVEAAKPTIDYANLGRPVELNKEIDIKGVRAVWVKGSTLLLELQSTKWDTMDGDRTGRARLRLRNGDQAKVINLEEGDSKTVFGYKISLKYAFEFYNNKDGRFMPHVKLTISR